ncbi:MAG: hypothetical protein KatS3mg031_0547 [Chitinophagales bacterium]|nr:MAG: hypothetical protein KatS3mg031_0547 [Chitinophagales bacterium]
MEQEDKNRKTPTVYSKTIRAGRRRTYFFDVRTTRGNDYYITITESKKRFHEDGYERHKVFLYKEDFNKFMEAMNEVINHVKTDLLPEYDFDEFSKNYDERNYDDNDLNDSAEAEEEKDTGPVQKQPSPQQTQKESASSSPPVDDDDLKM